MKRTSKGKTSRQSAPKVRSGCLTWVRRVKCDEAKPACVRCSSTGRSCDGYDLEKRFRSFEPRQASKGPAPASLEAQQKRLPPTVRIGERHQTLPGNLSLVTSPSCTSLLHSPGSPEEQRSLDFFLKRTAPALGGFFDVDFWSRLLPRVAAAEKPVQHALIAIATLHEESLRCSEPSFLSQPGSSLAQYNKAIRSLNQRVSAEGDNQRVILLTCILFVCLEFMRGTPEIGLNHLQSGLNILVSHKAGNRTSTDRFLDSDSSSSDMNELDEIDNGIEHAFSRLSIQASIDGRRLPPEFYQNVEVGLIHSLGYDSFSSIQEARDSLNVLVIQSLRPTDFLLHMDPIFSHNAQQVLGRYKLLACLNQWTTRLGLFMTDNLQNPTPKDMDAIRLLRIQSIIAIIWNSTTLSDSETAFDNYRTQFNTIVSLASQIVDKSAISASTSDGSKPLIPVSSEYPAPSAKGSAYAPAPQRASSVPPLFTIEMGIIFALYFTAIKCRCPIIRRTAVYLLSRAEPQREGMWDARILEKLCQYVIRFEEAGSLLVVSHDASTWPVEEQRIHAAYNMPNHDLEKRLQEVGFISRPGGPGGEWVHWSEKIHY